MWNIPGRPLVYVYSLGRASFPAPPLPLRPEFKKHWQTHMGLRSPCLHRHLEKSLIGYTCGHWGEGWPIFSPLFLGCKWKHKVRQEPVQGPFLFFQSRSTSSKSPWQQRDAWRPSPRVSVWVHWAAVFLRRRWVRDDGSSHPAEP